MSVHDYTLFEQRREEILDVARECFAEKGFNATTMAEVARRARMSVGNLYNYFHGKAAIIESLAEREVKNSPTRSAVWARRVPRARSALRTCDRSRLMRWTSSGRE